MPGLTKRNSAPRTPPLLAYPKLAWPFDWPTHMKIPRTGPGPNLLTEFSLGEMCTAIWTRNVRETSRTDEMRTAFQLQTDASTELVHLVARTTDLNLGAVALAFVSAAYVTITSHGTTETILRTS